MSLRLEPVAVSLRVRPADLDGLGHVNNAAVLEYLEAGRWAWMDHHGINRGHAILPVVSRIEIDYVREIPYGDVRVVTALGEGTGEGAIDMEDLSYRASFRQEVSLVPSATVVARANVAIAFIDRTTRTLCTLQDFVRASAAPPG